MPIIAWNTHEQLHLIRPVGETDLLWCVEEALRSDPVSRVIAEPEKPLALTVGRRLQLPAEAGRTTGLMLIRQNAGSNATETRWNCDPLPATSADSTLHQWALILTAHFSDSILWIPKAREL